MDGYRPTREETEAKMETQHMFHKLFMQRTDLTCEAKNKQMLHLKVILSL